jgi:hypothetical protein
MNSSTVFTNKLYPAIFSLLFFVMLMPVLSTAQDSNHFSIDDDINVDFVSRLTHDEAEFAITTREKSIDLLLTPSMIVIQFTDAFMDQIDDEINNDSDADDSAVVGEVIRSMVSSGIRTLLDRAMAIPLTEISEISYDEGRIIITDRDGNEIFRDLEIDDKKVMEDFSRRDARRFVAAAEKRMI